MGLQKLLYTGISNDDSILIGSHGNALIKAEGQFDLAGIVYCPKYNVTIEVRGNGKIHLRGICNRVIIRKISGASKVDLSQLACKELICLSLKDSSILITGRVRTISNAFLADNSRMMITEKPLIFNYRVAANARIENHPEEVPKLQ